MSTKQWSLIALLLLSMLPAILHTPVTDFTHSLLLPHDSLTGNSIWNPLHIQRSGSRRYGVQVPVPFAESRTLKSLLPSIDSLFPPGQKRAKRRASKTSETKHCVFTKHSDPKSTLSHAQFSKSAFRLCQHTLSQASGTRRCHPHPLVDATWNGLR